MPAEVGQHDDLEVLVLEVQGPPARDRAPVREVVAERVRIVEALRLEDVERRVDVGQALLMGREVEVALPGVNRRRRWRGRGRCRFRRPCPRGQAEEGSGARVQRESQRAHEGLLAILGTNDSQTQGKAKERKMIRKT
jgi:hypothetical protein